MTDRSTGPRCGNDPRAQLTDGDRQAVDSFRAYLTDRAALHRVRTVLETEAVVGRSALEYRGLILTALMADDPEPAVSSAGRAPATDQTTPQPPSDIAAADDPTPLRWGLNDVLWGDDDSVTVLLSGPDGEPYWLELDEERAAVLRGDLAGPGGEQPPADRAAVLREAADWYAQQGRTIIAASQVAADLSRRADAETPPTCDADGCSAPAGHYTDCPSAAPADQTAGLRAVADRIEDHEPLPERGLAFIRGVEWVLGVLRRMADETQPAETEPDFTEARAAFMQLGRTPSLGGLRAELRIDGHPPLVGRYCGASMGRMHDVPGHEHLLAVDPRLIFEYADEQPAAGARQDEPWPVKDAARRYAEDLRGKPSTVVADGHTGWACDAGAQLLVAAETPRPGRVATHHGVIYACAAHHGAAVDRITGSGYEVDTRPAPPGHRWDPWPCGHVTAYSREALSALAADEPAVGARQDEAQQ